MLPPVIPTAWVPSLFGSQCRLQHCPGWRKYEQNNVSIKIQTNTEDCGMGRRENRSI